MKSVGRGREGDEAFSDVTLAIVNNLKLADKYMRVHSFFFLF